MRGNASWQGGYITLVNLKLTSEQLGQREATDYVMRQTSSKQRGQTLHLIQEMNLSSRRYSPKLLQGQN